MATDDTQQSAHRGAGKDNGGHRVPKARGGSAVPVLGKQAQTTAYKYRRTKEIPKGDQGGLQQDEFTNVKGGESLYKESFKGEPREKSYKGQPGGWD